MKNIKTKLILKKSIIFLKKEKIESIKFSNICPESSSYLPKKYTSYLKKNHIFFQEL